MLYIKKLFNIKDKFSVFVLLTIFVYVCSSSIPKGIFLGMSLSEYILFTITDHYYLMYAWFFFIIFWSLRRLREKDNHRIVRFKSYKIIYFKHIIDVCRNIGLILFLHFLTAFVIGVFNFSLTTGFKATINYPEMNELEVLSVYNNTVNNAELSLFLSIIYIMAGSIVINLIIFFISECWNRKVTFLTMLILVISSMVGFNSGIDEGIMAPLFVNNWFILHHGLFTAGEIPFFVTIIFLTILLTGLFRAALNHNISKKRIKYFSNLFVIRKEIIFLYLSIISFLNLVPMFGSSVATDDVIWKLLSGYSYENFNLTEFLFYVSIYAFPILFINATWESEKRNRQEIALIRVVSRKTWTRLRVNENLSFILRYFLAYLFISGTIVFCSMIFTVKDSDYNMANVYFGFNTSEDNVVGVIILAIIFRFAEINILYLLDTFIFKITDNTIVSFFMTFLFYLPCIITGSSGYLIFGKASLQQICMIAQRNILKEILPVLLINVSMVIFIKYIDKKTIGLIMKKQTVKEKENQKHFKEVELDGQYN